MNSSTTQDLKTLGRNLQASILRAGGQLSLQQAYNVVGEMAGHSNWQGILAAARPNAPAPAPQAVQSAPIRLELSRFDGHGNPMLSTFSAEVSTERLKDILDHAVQVALMGEDGADVDLSQATAELHEALEVAGLLEAACQEPSLSTTTLTHGSEMLDDSAAHPETSDLELIRAADQEDDLAEWVGLNYGLHWESLARERQQDFASRYLRVLIDFDADLSTPNGKLAVLVACGYGYGVEEDDHQAGRWMWRSRGDGCDVSQESREEAIESAWRAALQEIGPQDTVAGTLRALYLRFMA